MATPNSTKICSSCNSEKPLSLFGRQSGYRDGHRNQCNACRSRKQAAYTKTDAGKASQKRFVSSAERREKRKWRVRHKKYGMSRDSFSEMLLAQNGRCALCSTDKPGSRYGFCIDHCHETGRVRGILCHNCNSALGKLGDTPTSISRALAYVQAKTSALL
ncbi:endonuclease VII domain-containing protein [Mesorhizobium sp.]|uniref:endonuclease VII domain-containing protein n=1 Tax=Mesorhizobium sp. TaxID=1871066 RepID=UPI000FE5085D|nr:MAG: hypothetical protein EOS09_19225 [Mesorhizobium sp.]